MTENFWLDWAIISVSLFNTIVLLWLGLTVLLNANRRDWGVWLMSGGLLAGAAFFVSHSAILGQEILRNFDGLNFWWRVGWFPVTLSPFAWYVAVLWYSGFWAVPQSELKHRHRLWLWIMGLWLVGLLVLLLAANPIPAYEQMIQLNLAGTISLRNVPFLFLLFPLWMVVCILLSIDVLPKPVYVSDTNTQIARKRSRPWLLGTAASLLAVSLVVSYFIGSIVINGTSVAEGAISIHTIALYDLIISMLIALSALLLGQAIVSYEIFTGRVLPRRNFVRHWRNAVIFATGYALVIGWGITSDLRPIYSLLAATLLLTLFYALYSWRTFWEREQFMARLRPFVQTQEMSANPLYAGASASGLLAALCHDVLGTLHAQLIALGTVAPLVSAPLIYPPESRGEEGGERSPFALQLPRDLNDPMRALDESYAPYQWAISLWDERGRIGVLLIGEKSDGGLYSQEEMETAQATGERIIHLLAGEQMVLRLMELQRKRTAEQRVMDLRTRRTLHDEILPALHLAVLQLSSADRQQPLMQEPVIQEPVIQDTVRTLAEAHQQIANLLTNTQSAPSLPPEPWELVGALHNLVATEFVHSFEQIVWHGLLCKQDAAVDDGELREAGKLYVDPMVGEVIMGAAREVMRNAASHGRGGKANRPLRVQIGLNVQEENPDEILLHIQDNGVGIAATRTRTSRLAGGNGLALHTTLLAMVGGYLAVESPPEDGRDDGTLVRIAVTALPTVNAVVG